MKYVELKIDDGIATLTLDHPAGNRINFQMREQVLEAFEHVAASSARVLLVKGAGADFCLGGDIRDWPGIGSEELRPRIEIYAKAIDVLESLPIPTVAVVQGGCMGGGFELALGCDLIVAATSARFMFPESLLGMMTLQGGVYMLAERVGRNKALELYFMPEPVGALRMAEWNVVNRVVEDTQLEIEAQSLAVRLKAGPAEAYKRTKELMRIWQRSGRVEARSSLYDISMPLFDTPSVQKALSTAVEAVNAGQPIPKA